MAGGAPLSNLFKAALDNAFDRSFHSLEGAMLIEEANDLKTAARGCGDVWLTMLTENFFSEKLEVR